MSHSFSLADAASLGDLKVFLGRSARIGCESVRMLGDSGVLAAYVATLAPRGLLDTTPTILGLRTFALADSEAFDVILSTRALLDRLAQHSLTVEHGDGPMSVPLPPAERPEAWAGITPPRSGWERAGQVSVAVLDLAASEGVAEVAAALPDQPGESVAQRIRSDVWARPIPGVDVEVPRGVAFAAHSLGFLANEDAATVHRAGRWCRVTTRRGHVLARLAS